jgi:glycosyltransferase involved in cell wall biosynthesis
MEATGRLNIISVTDGEPSSGTLVMENIIRHSRHQIRNTFWNPVASLDNCVDLVYLHYGGVMTPWSTKLNTLIRKRRDVKWIGGIRGRLNLKRWSKQWPPEEFCDFVHYLDGISCANQRFADLARKMTDIPVFVCHSGVDTMRFTPSQLPDYFNIGWAGVSSAGSKRFRHIMRLPFPKRTATDLGTWREFNEMPSFYQKISAYVIASVEEGSPVPPKEAAACGRPVVGVDCGDLVEWVPPRWIVKNGDGWKERIIPVIRKLQDDRELLVNESARFRRLAEQWDYRTVVQEYDGMFEDVASE